MLGRGFQTTLALAIGFLLLSRVSAADETGPDENLLRQAGIATDAEGLLAFLRKLSPSEADHQQLAVLVQQLGSDKFEDREAASRLLLSWNLSALKCLRAVVNHSDPEVARRAQDCIDQIEGGPGLQLPMAATRLLAVRRPAGGIVVLLNYLPHTSDLTLQDTILETLATLAATGPTNTDLQAALKDPVLLRRAAAAYVLGQSPAEPQRRAVVPLLADRQAYVRFRAAEGLLAARDKVAVPALIDLLLEPTGELSYRTEDLLVRLAGEQAPAGSWGEDLPGRQKRREAWRAWWTEQGPRLDLAKLDQTPPYLGLTLIPEMHANKVWEYDREGKVLWQLGNLQCPIDAQVLPGGRLLVAELNGNCVTERDRSGKILWRHNVSTPIACQRLANGQTFIGTNHRLCVVAPDGKETWSYAAENGFFIHSVQRLRNGHYAMVSMEGKLREIDATGKEVRTLPLTLRGGWSGIEGVTGNRYLVVNNTQGKILELDNTGKTVWECTVGGACYASRLPSGNTLVVSNNKGLVEVDRNGKTVSEKSMSTALWRVHRR